MFCTNCGREIIDTARFCNYCGRPVQTLAPPPPPYQSQNAEQPYTADVSAPEASAPAPNSEPIYGAVSDATDAFPENPSDILDTPGFRTENYDDTPEMNADAASSDTVKPDAPAYGSINSEAAPETGSIPQQPVTNNTSYAFGDTYPTPGAIPKSGASVSYGPNASNTSGIYSMPTRDTTVNISPEPAAAKPERERKYTLGHILLCLASTAVMAIAAGVFAGLYFSAI